MQRQFYQLRVTDSTLWVTAAGSSKLSIVKDYVRDFRAAAKPLLGKPWACVLDLRQWQPSPHEALTLLQDNTRWCYQHQLELGIAIVPDNAVSVWQYLKATSEFTPANAVRYQVKTVAEAHAILSQAGYLSAV